MNSVAEQPIYAFSEFRLDPARRLLTRDGETVVLHSKAFDLLLVFIENHDRLLLKDELLECVWEGQFVEENNLAVQVSALRKVLVIQERIISLSSLYLERATGSFLPWSMKITEPQSRR